MTLEQFKKLDLTLVDRVIAEVVCGWTAEDWQDHLEDFCCEIIHTLFSPTNSIDDAVTAVEKLDERNLLTWFAHLYQIVNPELRELITIKLCEHSCLRLVNASALQRCLALWLTLPAIETRYRELDKQQ